MVLVEDGVIRDVDVTGAPPPQHATVTDFGQGGWLLPGLVDAHVHLCWDAGTDAVAHVASGDRDTVLKTARASAATALQAGITTVRDLGDRDYLTLSLRDLVPPTERPEIVAAGPPITTRTRQRHHRRQSPRWMTGTSLRSAGATSAFNSRQCRASGSAEFPSPSPAAGLRSSS